MNSKVEWAEVEKLAYAISWRYSKKVKGSVSFDDLVSACKCAFFERQDLIDVEAGKSRYLYKVFTGTVLDEISRSKKFSERESHESLLIPQAFPIFDFLESTSGDVRLIVERVLFPERLQVVPLKTTPTSLRSAIKKEMKQRGWTYQRTEKAFGELHKMLFA